MSTPAGLLVRKVAPYAWLAALLFVVLFWRLGAPSFWDPDEAHYAQTTREMIQTGDWLAPYYDQRPFFDKPVLFHLLQAVPMTIFGLTEFSARLVPALASLALVLTTWWLGSALASRKVGFAAAALLAVSPGVFGLSRYAILDTLFTAWLFGGISLLAVAALRDRPSLQYPAYALIGLAILTKGPLALALCGIAFLLAIALSPDARRRLLALRWVLGAVIAAAIAAPWFVYMLARFGDAFVQGYVMNENITLFSRPPYGNQPGWTFYFQILAVGLLPWTFVLIGRLVDDARQVMRGGALDTFEILLWSWVAAIVGFFTLSAFKLDHYVFPAAPALCLLIARAWSDVRERQDGDRWKASAFGVACVGPLLLVVGVAAGVFIIQRLALPIGALAAPVALAAAGVALIVNWRRGRLPRVPWGAISAFAVTYAVAILFVGPALEQGKVIPEIAAWVDGHAGATASIAAYRLDRWDPALRFYVSRPIQTIRDADAAYALAGTRAGSAPPVYLVMRETDLAELTARGIPLEVVHARAGMWATSGKALWRQRGALTNFVVAIAGAAQAPPAGRYNPTP